MSGNQKNTIENHDKSSSAVENFHNSISDHNPQPEFNPNPNIDYKDYIRKEFFDKYNIYNNEKVKTKENKEEIKESRKNFFINEFSKGKIIQDILLSQECIIDVVNKFLAKTPETRSKIIEELKCKETNGEKSNITKYKNLPDFLAALYFEVSELGNATNSGAAKREDNYRSSNNKNLPEQKNDLNEQQIKDLNFITEAINQTKNPEIDQFRNQIPDSSHPFLLPESQPKTPPSSPLFRGGQPNGSNEDRDRYNGDQKTSPRQPFSPNEANELNTMPNGPDSGISQTPSMNSDQALDINMGYGVGISGNHNNDTNAEKSNEIERPLNISLENKISPRVPSQKPHTVLTSILEDKKEYNGITNTNSTINKDQQQMYNYDAAILLQKIDSPIYNIPQTPTAIQNDENQSYPYLQTQPVYNQLSRQAFPNYNQQEQHQIHYAQNVVPHTNWNQFWQGQSFYGPPYLNSQLTHNNQNSNNYMIAAPHWPTQDHHTNPTHLKINSNYLPLFQGGGLNGQNSSHISTDQNNSINQSFLIPDGYTASGVPLYSPTCNHQLRNQQCDQFPSLLNYTSNIDIRTDSSVQRDSLNENLQNLGLQIDPDEYRITNQIEDLETDPPFTCISLYASTASQLRITPEVQDAIRREKIEVEKNTLKENPIYISSKHELQEIDISNITPSPSPQIEGGLQIYYKSNSDSSPDDSNGKGAFIKETSPKVGSNQQNKDDFAKNGLYKILEIVKKTAEENNLNADQVIEIFNFANKNEGVSNRYIENCKLKELKESLSSKESDESNNSKDPNPKKQDNNVADPSLEEEIKDDPIIKKARKFSEDFQKNSKNINIFSAANHNVGLRTKRFKDVFGNDFGDLIKNLMNLDQQKANEAELLNEIKSNAEISGKIDEICKNLKIIEKTPAQQLNSTAIKNQRE